MLAAAHLCLHAATCSKERLTAAGVVHWSVNPDTIALVVHDGQMCAKLTGFESSQTWESMECLSRFTPGTSYSAPEVCNGCYTSAADLWSLGGVVYWLLSGCAPSGVGKLHCRQISISSSMWLGMITVDASPPLWALCFVSSADGNIFLPCRC